jgi:prevent-host-death family protein
MKTSTETVSAFTAKTHLSGLLKEVQKGNLYIVTLRGKPIAKIIPYNDDIKEDSIEVALQNLNTVRQKTKGKVAIRSMINEGRKH